MEVVFFNRRVEKFFTSVEPSLRPRVARTFELLELYAPQLGLPHTKALGKGLFELRIVGVIQLRFFYTFHRGKVWVLHGIIKKTNRIPRRELDYAQLQLQLLLRQYNK